MECEVVGSNPPPNPNPNTNTNPTKFYLPLSTAVSLYSTGPGTSGCSPSPFRPTPHGASSGASSYRLCGLAASSRADPLVYKRVQAQDPDAPSPRQPLPSPLRLQASAAARHALASAAAKLLSPLTLTQLPQLLYPCSHSYCQTRRLLLTLTLTLTLSEPFDPKLKV